MNILNVTFKFQLNNNWNDQSKVTEELFSDIEYLRQHSILFDHIIIEKIEFHGEDF